MVDWFVLLTPILVLGVILLLGFTGCDLVFVVNPPPSQLNLKVRTPAEFTVDQANTGFSWTDPVSGTFERTTTLDRTDEGTGIAILSHLIKDREAGSWTVSCRIRVTDGSGQSAADGVNGQFVLDEGIDVADAIGEALHSDTGDPSHRPPGRIKRLVGEGSLGRKSGRGFYDYR